MYLEIRIILFKSVNKEGSLPGQGNEKIDHWECFNKKIKVHSQWYTFKENSGKLCNQKPSYTSLSVPSAE